MATRGRVKWKKIASMLDECTGKWSYQDKTHMRWVYVEGIKQAFKLPQGAHGASNPEIEIGHIRSMTRYFDIIDCAKSVLEQLR